MTDGYLEHMRSERDRARERLAELEHACGEGAHAEPSAPLQEARAELARLTALVAKLEPWHV